MPYDQWLKDATKRLSAAKITTARLDAMILMEDATGQDRAFLLAHPELLLSAGQIAKLTFLLNRRARHEPLAYIRGKSEFYGRDFIISSDVLVPRPESEAMIGLMSTIIMSDSGAITNPNSRQPWNVADVGCGSGALGITAALEFDNVHVELLDISEAAIRNAKANDVILATSLNVSVSDLLIGATQPNDILMCNLPYVPDDYEINEAARQEPPIALFGGADGLDIYRRLFFQISNLSLRTLYILTEALPESHPALAEMASKHGYELIKTDDFIQLFVSKTIRNVPQA